MSGVDKIDLRDLGVGFEDIQATASGADMLIDVDTDGVAGADLQIRLVNAAAPVQSDFIFT